VEIANWVDTPLDSKYFDELHKSKEEQEARKGTSKIEETLRLALQNGAVF